MNVDGKKISFESVPKVLKNVGSRIASIVKTATKKLSNWYASRVKIESFGEMSFDRQDKIIKNQEQYFDDKANRLAQKDASLASARLEYDANEALIREKEDDISSINFEENVGADSDEDKKQCIRDFQQEYIDDLKIEKEALEKRNEEIRAAQEQRKNEIKADLIANSNYSDLVKLHEEKEREIEQLVADDSSEDAEESKNTQEEQSKRIEENLDIRFSQLDDREEIDNIEKIYAQKEIEVFNNIKEEIVKLLNDAKEILSVYNTEKINSIINLERNKRDSVLKSSSEKIETLTSENAKLKDSLTNIQTDLGNSQSENKRLESEIERLKSEKSLLEQQKEELIAEKKTLHEELSEEKRTNTNLTNSIRKLENDETNIRATFGREIMNLKDKQAVEIKEIEKKHEEEIKFLKDEIKGLKVERSNIAKILNGGKDSLDNLNSNVRKETINSLNDVKNSLTNNYSVTVDSNFPSLEGYEDFFKGEDNQAQKRK